MVANADKFVFNLILATCTVAEINYLLYIRDHIFHIFNHMFFKKMYSPIVLYSKWSLTTQTSATDLILVIFSLTVHIRM